MTNEVQAASRATDSVKFEKLFGPAPVLSTESIEAYNAVMARLMECFKPEDFMLQLFVKDLTDATWECLRYTRHKALAIDRKFRQRLEVATKQRKEIEAKKQAAELLRKERPDAPLSLDGIMFDIEFLLSGMEDDAKKSLGQTPREVDHAGALEEAFDYYERLDRGHCIAMARRNDILEQITLYRDGLAHHLRRVSDKIIDGEFSEAKQEKTGLISSNE